jgi:4-hydroxy-4-methyl-2-oxoglutarate aldolase
MVITLNPRPEPDVTKEQLDALRKLPPASIGHVLDHEFMDNTLRPLTRRFAFCGPAVTVRCYGSDSAIVHYAVDIAQPGDVIVVDRVGDRRYACWGGGVSLAAHTKGIAGAVVDGMLTDRIEIEEMGFHVFGRGLSAVTTRAPGESGEVNVPVTCGGNVINPGDIILADDDGILVLPPSRVQEIIDFFTPRVAREPEGQKATLAGESLAERSGARARLEANLAKQEAEKALPV